MDTRTQQRPSSNLTNTHTQQLLPWKPDKDKREDENEVKNEDKDCAGHAQCTIDVTAQQVGTQSDKRSTQPLNRRTTPLHDQGKPEIRERERKLIVLDFKEQPRRCMTTQQVITRQAYDNCTVVQKQQATRTSRYIHNSRNEQLHARGSLYKTLRPHTTVWKVTTDTRTKHSSPVDARRQPRR